VGGLQVRGQPCLCSEILSQKKQNKTNIQTKSHHRGEREREETDIKNLLGQLGHMNMS
jgi:hypothetical protein